MDVNTSSNICSEAVSTFPISYSWSQGWHLIDLAIPRVFVLLHVFVDQLTTQTEFHFMSSCSGFPLLAQQLMGNQHSMWLHMKEPDKGTDSVNCMKTECWQARVACQKNESRWISSVFYLRLYGIIKSCETILVYPGCSVFQYLCVEVMRGHVKVEGNTTDVNQSF